MSSEMLNRVKQLWETWDIRVLMLTSLIIQAFLTVLAPYRKRCSNSLLTFLIWVLYLAADAVALYTIGLISSGQDDTPQGAAQRADLLAFWAPFLLLHLGGPDTITALALEDNELYLRHALQLTTQVGITVYVFLRSLDRNHLWIPTVLVFVDGLIKYTERTCALYFASMENFRDSQRTKPEPGPNYARFMEEYSSAKGGHIPTEIKDGDSDKKAELPQEERGVSRNNGAPENESDCQWYRVEETEDMVCQAHEFYKKFRGLLVDAFLSLKDRDESRDFFVDKAAPEAFRIVEIELNFVYDVFYTKVSLLHAVQCCARVISLLAVMASLVYFSFKDKSDYRGIDIGITFALLGGAIALDIVATVIFVSSDWSIIISSDWKQRGFTPLSWGLLGCLRCARDPCSSRWSQKISKYNLLTRCLKVPPSFVEHFFIRRVKDVLIGWLYVCSNQADEKLGNFIYKELQEKAKQATDTESAKELCSARGTLVSEDDFFLVSEYLRPWTVNVDYDESVLIWHLATDICYYWSTPKDKDNDHCKISKKISDYMSYLLLRQQALLSTVVGMSDIRFDDTCAEAKQFMPKTSSLWYIQDAWAETKKFMREILRQKPSAHEEIRRQKETEMLEQFCAKVLRVKTDVQPIQAKGDKSKSVLFDACRLAKQLKMFGDQQWVITSKVWVELLCYAAVRCAPRSHVAQLSKGGELITLLWLLMAHLGLGERFRQNRGFGWTKLVIHK